MAVTVDDWAQLARLLRENSEIRREFASLLVSEELAGVRSALASLAAAQERTEQRLEALTGRVEALAEAQIRTEQRLEALTGRVDALTEAQIRTEHTVQTLVEEVRGLKDVTGGLRGESLERRYRERAAAYFGKLLRRVRVVSLQDFETEVDAALTAEEVDDLLLLDLLVAGRPRAAPTEAEVWLAVEISGRVDRDDVKRAHRRAGFLRRAGFRTVPAVAGEGLTEGAHEEAERLLVVVLVQGRVENWPQAIAAAS